LLIISWKVCIFPPNRAPRPSTLRMMAPSSSAVSPIPRAIRLVAPAINSASPLVPIVATLSASSICAALSAPPAIRANVPSVRSACAPNSPSS
jgi:hypothetical protein